MDDFLSRGSQGMLEIFYVKMGETPQSKGGQLLNKEVILILTMAGSPDYRHQLFTARELVDTFSDHETEEHGDLLITLTNFASKKKLATHFDNINKEAEEPPRWFGESWFGLLKPNALYFAREIMEKHLIPAEQYGEAHGWNTRCYYSNVGGFKAAHYIRAETPVSETIMVHNEPENFFMEEMADEEGEGFMVVDTTTWQDKVHTWVQRGLALVAAVLLVTSVVPTLMGSHKKIERKPPHVYDEAEKYWQYQPSHLVKQ